ncbi:unnamed protein product [Effrenium voratum]|uniref:Uncharacterized protein n=1 Tax=Effrenium voratum TaxID=2562239 RepID=A0AA36HTA9_9DINO|nr:unnamed protein product [Effrenium voratum]
MSLNNYGLHTAKYGRWPGNKSHTERSDPVTGSVPKGHAAFQAITKATSCTNLQACPIASGKSRRSCCLDLSNARSRWTPPAWLWQNCCEELQLEAAAAQCCWPARALTLCGLDACSVGWIPCAAARAAPQFPSLLTFTVKFSSMTQSWSGACSSGQLHIKVVGKRLPETGCAQA